ncbi:MAG: aminotransferase class V-fold PLP-dependent enzyme, partial [Alphaproteobacteria bacterium]|nr:aminotransferase class V-fold PLP-dependent enzyme [Alphaproteobacteria bacterium]
MPGRHFLQIPGPTNVPDRVLRAMDYPTIDHRGPAFRDMSAEALSGIKSIFKTSQPVIIFPSSGTGAWEAALVNTLSSGDRVLMSETGHFATLWKAIAERLGVYFQKVVRFLHWRLSIRSGPGTLMLRNVSDSPEDRMNVHKNAPLTP